MKHSTFLIGLLAAILSLLSVQTAQAADKLRISSASATKSAYQSSYSVSNVHDGNPSTKYWSNGSQSVGENIQVTLAEASPIGSVKLYFDTGDQPRAAKIEYSADGSSWTIAAEFTNSDIVNRVYTCNIPGGPTAQYVRMYITTAISNWLQLCEFEVYGIEEVTLSDYISDAPIDGEWAENTHWLKIKNGSGNYLSSSYLKSGTTHLALDQSTDPGEDGYWCIVGDETNGFSFYNFKTRKILEMTPDATDEGSVYAQLADPNNITTNFTTKFDITASSYSSGSVKWWNVKGHGSTNAYWTQHGNHTYDAYNCLAYWYSSLATSNAGSAFTFELVTLPTIDVTINYNGGDGYTFARNISKSSGSTLTLEDLNVDFYTGFALAESDRVIYDTNKTFNVTCTPDFPFTEGHVYKMHGANYVGDQQSVNASDYCFTARTEDSYITYQGVKDAIDANSYWIFEHVAGTQDQFYVYNMGVGKYLSSKTSRQPAIMAEKGSADGANQIFRITRNGDGFNLQHQIDNNCCGTHRNGRGENPYLATAWGTATDPSHDASRVYIMDIAPELAALGNDPATTEGYVGEGPSQVLKTAAAAAGETPTKANVVACLDAYNNPKLADYVTANKYYQIFFVSSDNTTNKALTLKNATQNYNSSDGTFSLETSNTAMAVAPVAEASLSQTDFIASLYTLTAGTTGMTVTNVNANVPWGAVNITNGLLATTGAGTEYPFAVVSGQSDNSRWNIETGNGYLAFNSADHESVIVNNTESGTTARLKEVTSIPVTIKNTLWTSLCFPVDVVIPANLKVYKAASTQGMTINLEELAEGSRIPAGTGFLALAGAGGNYSFAIATGSEPEADVSGNQFTGANVKRAGMDGVEYFALATKNAVTGFYKVTTGTVPANKAYLLGEKLNQGAGANMLQFAFGEGTETGISNVNAENSGKAETYYDLNGRLVVYPTRGVYVTGSGRKVFVK